MTPELEAFQGMPERSFEAGKVLVSEGHRTGVLYILKEGAVEVLKGRMSINEIRSAGSVFGEISILLDRPHMASIKVLEPSIFFVAENPKEFLLANPEVSLNVARLLAMRLNHVTNYLVDLKRQFSSEESHLGMVDEVLEELLHHQRGPSS